MNRQRIREYLFCAACTVLMIFALINFTHILKWLASILKVLSPIIIGGAIAFVLARPFNFFEEKLRKTFYKIKNTKIHTAVALLLVYLIMIGFITLLFWFVIPQLTSSINLFVTNLETYYKNLKGLTDNISSTIHYDIWTELKIDEQFLKISKALPELAAKTLPQIYSFTTGLINSITNIVLGLVISIYLILDKKKLSAQTQRLMYTFLPSNFCDKTIKLSQLVSKTFSNFITGQLTDAFILGVLCFICMNLFRFEYAFLISVIVAITNVIPIVGPIIGSVPSAFILLLVNPIHAVWFVVFIIVLQQIEANLIYPKIVGDSVGLPAIWVLIAVIIGGGMFGILGMVLGIPTLSIFYVLLRNRINHPEGSIEESN